MHQVEEQEETRMVITSELLTYSPASIFTSVTAALTFVAHAVCFRVVDCSRWSLMAVTSELLCEQSCK